MSLIAEISYLQQRAAAATLAADSTADRGVRMIHRQFAVAYERRIRALLMNERMAMPAIVRPRPGWAVKTFTTTTVRLGTETAARLVPVNQGAPRASADRCPA